MGGLTDAEDIHQIKEMFPRREYVKAEIGESFNGILKHSYHDVKQNVNKL